MSYTYKICIGDEYCDGHNQYQDFYFECSHDNKNIVKAYKSAEKKAGVGLTDAAKTRILSDYEQSWIDSEDLDSLRNIGCKFKYRSNKFNEDGILSCCPEDVFHLFMEMVQTQLPNFEYKVISPESISIGQIGYGVFN